MILSKLGQRFVLEALVSSPTGSQFKEAVQASLRLESEATQQVAEVQKVTAPHYVGIS
jgi:hypothetical protein